MSKNNLYPQKACMHGAVHGFGKYEYTESVTSENLMAGVVEPPTKGDNLFVPEPPVDHGETIVGNGDRVEITVPSKDVDKYIEGTLKPEFQNPEKPEVPTPKPNQRPLIDHAILQDISTPKKKPENKSFPWAKVLLIALGGFILVKIFSAGGNTNINKV